MEEVRIEGRIEFLLVLVFLMVAGDGGGWQATLADRHRREHHLLELLLEEGKLLVQRPHLPLQHLQRVLDAEVLVLGQPLPEVARQQPHVRCLKGEGFDAVVVVVARKGLPLPEAHDEVGLVFDDRSVVVQRICRILEDLCAAEELHHLLLRAIQAFRHRGSVGGGVSHARTVAFNLGGDPRGDPRGPLPFVVHIIECDQQEDHRQDPQAAEDERDHP
mmetsp:Transcript_4226/g.10487  ORF Transcript_4226/g.10487 Transcript_4226/m.10487 type:complete len:218 (-) Transcript_4226:1005-1658(-)